MSDSKGEKEGEPASQRVGYLAVGWWLTPRSVCVWAALPTPGNREEEESPDPDKSVGGPPGVTSRSDLFLVLEQVRGGTVTKVPARVTDVAVKIVRGHLLREAGGRAPRVLLVTTEDFHEIYHSTDVQRAIAELIRRGTGREVRRESAGACVDYLQGTFDRVLLPYKLDDGVVVITGVTYKGVVEGKYYVKVWGALDTWGQAAAGPTTIPVLQRVQKCFFKPRQSFSLYCKRAASDPSQDGQPASVEFPFLTTAYLAVKKRPPPVSNYGEALLRNYLCATCLQGKFHPLPRLVFKE